MRYIVISFAIFLVVTSGCVHRSAAHVSVDSFGRLTYNTKVYYPEEFMRKIKRNPAAINYSVVLQGQDGVTAEQMVELRQELIKNKIPNVIIRMPKRADSAVDDVQKKP